MLYNEEIKYIGLADKIMAEGYPSKDRTGVGTKKIHAANMEFSLENGRIPVLTTRYIPTKSIMVELLWFISGSTDIKFLKENGVSIWDSWVKEGTQKFDNRPEYGLEFLQKKKLLTLPEGFNRNEFFNKYGPGTINQMLGDLFGVEVPSRGTMSGSIGEGAYGAQWRRWDDTRFVIPEEATILKKYHGYESIITFTDSASETVEIVNRKYDQLQDAINLINNNPDSRRIIVSAWNPGRLDQAQLPPCHLYFQFLPFEKDGEKYLDLALVCRSQDFLVGTVFNVAQYAMLAHMVAKITGRKANKLFWTGMNTHIYNNQMEQYTEIHSQRAPQDGNDIRFEITGDQKTIDDFKLSDLKVTGYNYYGEVINYPIAV